MSGKVDARPFIGDPLWYKDAIIYQVHVKSFFDGNNDGVGDFPGLIEKLDYIAELGVNTLWLLPFYPSPRRDDGYDIANYRDVHPEYGTLSDFRNFIRAAHRRGIRVICELVINHTSDQHPWFQRARRAKRGSSARNYYVWSDDDRKYAGTRIIFLDTEISNWTWDPVAGQYFWHRFYAHQPDLNFDHPPVLKEVLSIMRFWFDMGVDGMRLDAIPYLIERDGTNNENLPETHQVLKEIRAELDRLYPDRMLLAEANQWPEDTRPYFGGNDRGEGDECHMAFHFPLMPRMYMALAQEDRYPITDILRQTPPIPDNCQWAIFLRNHDELTLEMVTERERDHLWSHYAADPRARINLGIRRRLAPLMERDRRRIELLNSLLLSMPGTPTIYYGDELGMGDNIFLGDRDGVRTPMQWSMDRNGGFSRADPAKLVLPILQDPLYGFHVINAESQRQDAHSLLNWTRRMLMVRKQQPAFGRGTMKMLAPANRRILAYVREYDPGNGEPETVVCVANVSRAAQAVELDLAEYGGKVPVEMIGGSAFPPISERPYQLTLAPYGFYWFVLASQNQMPSWYVEPPEQLPELSTLVVKRQLQEIFGSPLREDLEQVILPRYLTMRRWFAQREQPDSVKIRRIIPLDIGQDHPALLTEVEVPSTSGALRYQLPMGVVWDADDLLLPRQLAMARIRRGPEMGLLTDAFVMATFVKNAVAAMRKGLRIETSEGSLMCHGSEALAALDSASENGENDEVTWLSAEQSNSSARVGDTLVYKLLRTLHAGIHPEVEMGRYLTERGFTQCAALMGFVERVDDSGERSTLMLLQQYHESQGDGWAWTLSTLQRAIRDELAGGLSEHENQYTALLELDAFATRMGRQLGEMHTLLSDSGADGAFSPQVTSVTLANDIITAVQRQLHQALMLLVELKVTLPVENATLVDRLLAQREACMEALAAMTQDLVGGLLIRVHGDLHLGQLLVVQGDAIFIDFEGEPTRTLEERRARMSPYKDVTGILRSIDYAAAMARRDTARTDGSPQAMAASEKITGEYQQRTQRAFTTAYQEAAAAIPHQWTTPNGHRSALLLFSIEKAAYEVLYEGRHRPDWLSIPLNALQALLERQLLGGENTAAEEGNRSGSVNDRGEEE